MDGVEIRVEYLGQTGSLGVSPRLCTVAGNMTCWQPTECARYTEYNFDTCQIQLVFGYSDTYNVYLDVSGVTQKLQVMRG